MPVPKNRKYVITKALRKSGCDEERLKILMPSIDNLVWLEQKMEQGRALIASSAIVIPYDNGGGQKGVRKNPAFEAIHRMTASYNACLKAIVDAIPMSVSPTCGIESNHDAVQAKRDVIALLRQAETDKRGTSNGK